MSDLVTYKPDQIDDVWHLIEDMVGRGLHYCDEYTTDEIYQGLTEATMQLWTSHNFGIEMALVTAVQTDDMGKYCLLLCCAGTNIDEWAPWLEIVEKWAKEHGCFEMRIYGRIGWSRYLGYDVKYTLMSKSL